MRADLEGRPLNVAMSGMFYRGGGKKEPVFVGHQAGCSTSRLMCIISSRLCHNPMSWRVAIFYS